MIAFYKTKTPLSFNKWGFKISLPCLPSEQGVGERISEGIIAEWEGLSTSKKKKPG
jgi:hypothetical protein